MDGALQDELCRKLERHLSECDYCGMVLDTLKKTISLYQSGDRDTTIPDGVRERLFKRLELDEFVKKTLPASTFLSATFITTPHPNNVADTRNLSSLEMLLLGIDQPQITQVKEPLRQGAACPQCGCPGLDYNGLLQLECPSCGFVNGEGGGCT